MSLQIALLIKSFVADGAGKVVTLGMYGVDVSVQVSTA